MAIVFGLTRCWQSSRSVKNASSVGASGWSCEPSMVESSRSGDEREQLGRGGQVLERAGRVRRGPCMWRAAAAGLGHRRPSRYHSSSVRTANAWRRSCSRGRQPGERGFEPGGRDEPGEHVMDGGLAQPGAADRDQERVAAPAAGSAGRGAARSRSSARIVVSCSTTSRLLPNLLSRIRSSPWRTSTSARSRRIASPRRSPVTASSPISVR